MLSELFSNPISLLLYLLGLVVAVTIHEFSHAFVADYLGDPTARLKGRVTLNPLAHLDPIGTLMILVAHFGWGKPVPVDPYNFREPKKDSALTSLAGPISNLILAFLLSLILKSPLLSLSPLIPLILIPIIIVNVSLAFFNLLPISPLDGFAIVEGILPDDLARTWHSLKSIGMFLLLFLVIMPGSSALSSIINPPINFVLKLLLPSLP